MLLGIALAAFASDPGTVSETEIEKIIASVATTDTERSIIQRRLGGWRELQGAAKNQALAEPEKLKLVNDFIHETPFYCDPVMWCAEDFWSRPVEFLANDGGDCEDFSIAKYFSLKALGVAEEKLRIVYAVYQRGTFTGAHMVLAYYPSPDAEPLILDNINQSVQPASRRPDLIPVFSFNSQGLWGAKEAKGRGQPGEQYRAWSDHWKRVQSGEPVRSVSPEQRKSGECQAIIQRSPWCR
ncbi:MAG: sulfate adenylyltransferase [Betaproteobacteria bacterium]|nr:MAG: sulfate adenylyltransferase [Betaproteobacteria bacterium]